jgi:hypothetical protein
MNLQKPTSMHKEDAAFKCRLCNDKLLKALEIRIFVRLSVRYRIYVGI